MQHSFACLLVLSFIFILVKMQLASNFEQDDECLKDFRVYINSFLHEKSIINLFMYTGKEANDLGDHKNCVKYNGSYLVADFNKPNEPIVSLGLCVPLGCNTENMRSYKNILADVMNGMLKSHRFTEKEITVFSPAKANKDAAKIGPGFFITCIIIFLPIVLLIFGQIKGKSKDEPDQAPIKKLFNCFNLINNSAHLFNDNNHPEDVMNGLRVLAIFWVIIGQSLIITLKAPIYNFEEVVEVIRKERKFGLMITAQWGVDVFLCISGFFSAMASFNMLKDENNRNVLSFLKLYLYRYLRLFPIYSIGMLVAIFVVPILSEGPIYSRISELGDNCSNGFQWNFLMVNNFVGLSMLCLNWTWYIALDFQLFLLAPLFTLLFLRKSKIAYIVVTGIIGVSIILQVILGIINNINIYHIIDSYEVRNNLYEIITTKPYCRIDVYLLGTLAAWFYLTNDYINNSLKNSPPKRWLLYIVGIILVLITFFTYPEFYNSSPKPLALSSIYMALSKFLFIASLLILLYPSLLGKCRGSIILSIEFWGPLSKSTYTVYIFHFITFTFYIMALEEGVFFSFHKLVRNATDILVLTYLLAFIFTLIVDLPSRKLWKLILALPSVMIKDEQITSTEVDDKERLIKDDD